MKKKYVIIIVVVVESISGKQRDHLFFPARFRQHPSQFSGPLVYYSVHTNFSFPRSLSQYLRSRHASIMACALLLRNALQYYTFFLLLLFLVLLFFPYPNSILRHSFLTCVTNIERREHLNAAIHWPHDKSSIFHNMILKEGREQNTACGEADCAIDFIFNELVNIFNILF